MAVENKLLNAADFVLSVGLETDIADIFKLINVVVLDFAGIGELLSVDVDV